MRPSSQVLYSTVTRPVPGSSIWVSGAAARTDAAAIIALSLPANAFTGRKVEFPVDHEVEDCVDKHHRRPGVYPMARVMNTAHNRVNGESDYEGQDVIQQPFALMGEPGALLRSVVERREPRSHRTREGW